MIQGNNMIVKHFINPMPYCFQAICWSSILRQPQTLEVAISLIIEMFLQLNDSQSCLSFVNYFSHQHFR